MATGHDGDVAFDGYPLLHLPDLMLAVLRVAAAAREEGGGASVADGVALLRGHLKTAREDPPVGDDEIARRLEAARGRLAAAGLVEPAGEDDGRFRLTPLGRRVLDENPDGVDETVIGRYVGPGGVLAAASTGRAEEAPVSPGTRGGDAAPPPRQEAEYVEGMGAFREGRDIGDNPYPPQTGQHRAWAEGWSWGRDDEIGPLGG